MKKKEIVELQLYHWRIIWRFYDQTFFYTYVSFVFCFCFTKMMSNWIYSLVPSFLLNSLLWTLFQVNRRLSSLPMKMFTKLKRIIFSFLKVSMKNVGHSLPCSKIFSWVCGRSCWHAPLLPVNSVILLSFDLWRLEMFQFESRH